jgi:DNA-binding NarL/FixJ family response regulator
MYLRSGYARIVYGTYPTIALKDDQPLVITTDNQSPSVDRDRHLVAIVAPQWLQDGLAVVIKTIPRLQLVACTGSIHIFLSLDLEHAPELVVLAVDAQVVKARDQIRQVKFIYPRARYLVLIQEPTQNADILSAGADETLLQGASAQQFCAAVSRLIWGDKMG